MSSNPKRRKLNSGDAGLSHKNLIDFKSRDVAKISVASSFILKTDELLKEAKVNYNDVEGNELGQLGGQLGKIREIILGIKAHGLTPIAEATDELKSKHQIRVPYPEPKPAKDALYKVSFEAPSMVNVVGSFVSQTMVKTQDQFSIDMVVQMPKSLFQDKDYSSLRYFYRRSYYLAYIAANIKTELGDEYEAKFERLNDNPLLPVLAIWRKNSSKSRPKSFIRIIPCAPENLFPGSKLVPTACCRHSQVSDAPTPFYNSTLKAESTFVTYLRVLTQAKQTCPGFQDACTLGRIWLQQRGFRGAMSKGGFGHFEWAVMVALLLKPDPKSGHATLSASLSGSELFKAALQFLSAADFIAKPFIFGGAAAGQAKTIREKGPVMHDPTTELNLLYKMTPSSASLLQQHARSSTDLLADEAALDKFEPIFIVKANMLSQVFDDIFTIKPQDLSKYAESSDRRGQICDFGAEAHIVLTKAFGKRAGLVSVQPSSAEMWSLSAARTQEANTVIVGVVYDYAQMSRSMELGPSAEEQKEAAKFQQFWGDKAELRRFKDGSILECVEWSSKLPEDICREITEYILWQHLKIAREQIESHGRSSEPVVNFTVADKEAFDKARRAFTTFEHDIRNLDDLPLQIRQLSPISAAARYASIEAPMLGFHQGAVKPIEVNMYFEASSRWPENISAIQMAKVDFLVDIGRRLKSANDNVTTTILGREDCAEGIENLAYLDIVYQTGATFRVRIHCDLEETLLERQISNVTTPRVQRLKAGDALAKFHLLFTTRPLHTQTIATFCTRFPGLSPSIRLVKQWFSSHKLSRHFGQELIELFVLHVFLHPYPWKIPQSSRTGFYRTMDFLSRWNWRDDPLIVDSAEELAADDRSSIQKMLATSREADPSLSRNVLYVATSTDNTGQAFTRDGPDKIIASRMTLLAKSACKVLKEQDYKLETSTLFEHSLQDYDVLFHVSPKIARTIVQEAGLDPSSTKPSPYKNLSTSTTHPLRDHPINFLLSWLQTAYTDSLIFFAGAVDEDEDAATIGAIWLPNLRKQKFRPGLPYNMRSVEDDKVEINKQAVLNEIARIGGDVIKKIEEVEEDEEED